MRTLIDDVFDELIGDLNKWHKKYTNDSDIKSGLEDLRDIMQDYSSSSESQISELEQDKSWAGVDEAIEEGRIRDYE